MKKKMIALLLTTAMVAGSGTTVVFAAKEDDKTEDEKADEKKAADAKDSDSKDADKKDSEEKNAEETKEELPYAPKEDYDEYALVDFEIEDLGQDLDIVVSAMDDEKSFNLQMYFFGGDADINVTVDDDGNYEVTNDGGFFQNEGPLVVQQVLEENNWQAIEK